MDGLRGYRGANNSCSQTSNTCSWKALDEVKQQYKCIRKINASIKEIEEDLILLVTAFIKEMGKK